MVVFSGARINKQGRDQTHTLTWCAAAKAGQQRDRPHPAARAAEGPPSRVSSRTADTASQPMDQALGHNIIEEINGCENKERCRRTVPSSHHAPAHPPHAHQPCEDQQWNGLSRTKKLQATEGVRPDEGTETENQQRVDSSVGR